MVFLFVFVSISANFIFKNEYSQTQITKASCVSSIKIIVLLFKAILAV